ncbi:MAG: hypothetical protein LBF97_00885 [Elusimicrobiota bacterium]|jgi:hypothetical protein|nr:hypothetical protein [Elusimicrobiota bacterium]
MFKYGQLSDLLSGELVTPLRLEGENIICLNSNNEEVICHKNDFDFLKTPAQRNIIDDGISSDDLIEQMEIDSPEPEIIEVHTESVREVVREVQVENNKTFKELADSVKRKILKQAGLNFIGRLDNVTVDIESEEIIS